MEIEMVMYLNKLLIITLFFTSPIFANDTVTIMDEDGNIKICKVVESGAIVCL